MMPLFRELSIDREDHSPAELLRLCERSAVHLEMRDGYSRSDPRFLAWQQGQQYDPADWDSWWRPWLDLIGEARSRVLPFAGRGS